MAPREKGQEPSERATKQAEPKPKQQTKPRKPRRKPYQMTAVVLARETALLPEPLRSSVLEVARAIIRFFRYAWQEITAALADEPAPLLLPPADREEGNEQ